MELKSLIKKQEKKPPRILLYSIPGWGKSTFASSMPKPIFIDLEDGLEGIKAESFETPKSLDDIYSYIKLLIKEKHDYKTVVIDTVSSLDVFVQKEEWLS